MGFVFARLAHVSLLSRGCLGYRNGVGPLTCIWTALGPRNTGEVNDDDGTNDAKHHLRIITAWAT